MNYIINGSLVLLLLRIFYLTSTNIIEYKKYGNELLVPIPIGILSIIIWIVLSLFLGLFRNTDNIYYYIISFIVITFASFFVYTIYFYSYYQNSCKTSGFFTNFVYIILWILLIYLFKFFRIELKQKYIAYAISIFLIICMSIYSNSKFLNIPLLVLVIYIIYLIFTLISDSILQVLSYFSKLSLFNFSKFLSKNPFLSNKEVSSLSSLTENTTNISGPIQYAPAKPFNPSKNNIPIPPLI